MKINLIRNHISSHSFNYQDKLGVGDGELEQGGTNDINRGSVPVNKDACWLFSSCVYLKIVFEKEHCTV